MPIKKSFLPILLTIFIGILWILFSFQFIENGIFWDLGIYAKAINIFNSGGDPYSPTELSGYLSFVYHPLVLHGMALFGSWLSLLLITFYIASIVYFIFCLRKNSNLWLSAFLAFAYCGIGFISITSGNITVFFHLILLSILLKNTSQNLCQKNNENLQKNYIDIKKNNKNLQTQIKDLENRMLSKNIRIN